MFLTKNEAAVRPRQPTSGELNSAIATSVVIILLWAFFSLIQTSSGYAYTILAPVATEPILIKARRSEATLIIELSSKKEAAGLRVSSTRSRKNGPDIEPSGLYEKNGLSYLHYTLSLKKGVNTFLITPEEQVLKISYQPVRTLLNINFETKETYLFHRTAVIPQKCSPCHSEQLPEDAGLDVKRLQKNGDYSPSCFSCHRKLLNKDDWLHGPAANVSCMSCHRKGTGSTRVTMLTGRVEEVCFQCHTNKLKIKERKHVHGPVGTGDCTICHDPHGDTYKFQLWADGNIDLCIGCHGDKKKEGKRTIGFYPHGIIMGSGCVACHDPHAGDNRFQLYKPINELCVGCHLGLAGLKKGHPVNNHPVSGKVDSRRKGREFSCTSCHNPHGSNYRFLLIGDLLGGDVCSKCHDS